MQTITSLRSQLLNELVRTGLVHAGDLGYGAKKELKADAVVNRHAGNEALTTAVLTTGVPGNLASRRRQSHFGVMRTRLEATAGLHPASVSFHRSPPRGRYGQAQLPDWFMYKEMVLSSQVFLRDCSAVTPEQLALFVDAAKRPTAHASHARSTVAFGACVTRVPAAHTLCARQAPCPGWSWNESGEPAVHAVASSASAICPAAQFVHTRSVLAVASADRYVPLRHRCTLRHTVFPGDGWNCPLSQTSHALLALAFWICPGAHAWQYSAAVWLTSPVPKRPGSHASQKKALAVALCFPAGHALQLPAFSSTEN